MSFSRKVALMEEKESRETESQRGVISQNLILDEHASDGQQSEPLSKPSKEQNVEEMKKHPEMNAPNAIRLTKKPNWRSFLKKANEVLKEAREERREIQIERIRQPNIVKLHQSASKSFRILVQLSRESKRLSEDAIFTAVHQTFWEVADIFDEIADDIKQNDPQATMLVFGGFGDRVKIIIVFHLAVIGGYTSLVATMIGTVPDLVKSGICERFVFLYKKRVEDRKCMLEQRSNRDKPQTSPTQCSVKPAASSGHADGGVIRYRIARRSIGVQAGEPSLSLSRSPKGVPDGELQEPHHQEDDEDGTGTN